MTHGQRVFYLDIPAGKLRLEWTEHFLLSRVDWLGANPVAESGSFRLINKPTDLPQDWRHFVDELGAALQDGTPLSPFRWEQIDQSRWTDFQFQVYHAIIGIPHGETRPYSWVAQKIGKAFATRAVGQALRRNPVPIVIPCHRVIASNGGIGGFMGQDSPEGLELKLKEWLLGLERQYRNPMFGFCDAPLRPAFGDWVQPVGAHT